MGNFEQYHESFLEGFYFSINDDFLDNKVPKIDYSDIKSIGYYDGYQHGSKGLSVGRKSIVANLLEDVINQKYTSACKLHKNYEDKYVWYKSGFVSGVSDVREKYTLGDESFNVIPDLDDNDIYSIGYHDGYCYRLNKILNDNTELVMDNSEDKAVKIPIEEVTREYFKHSFSKYSVFTCDESKKIG